MLGDVLGLREVAGDGGSGMLGRDLALERSAALADRTLVIKAGKEDLSVRVEVLWAFSE